LQIENLLYVDSLLGQ